RRGGQWNPRRALSHRGASRPLRRRALCAGRVWWLLAGAWLAPLLPDHGGREAGLPRARDGARSRRPWLAADARRDDVAAGEAAADPRPQSASGAHHAGSERHDYGGVEDAADAERAAAAPTTQRAP